jgi:hypothetical protein
MKRISYPLIAVAGVGVLSLGVLGACGISYATASKNGAQYEAQIAATRKKVTEQDESLRQAIIAATGVDTITATDTRHAVALAMRRPGADGAEIVLRGLQGGAHELPKYSPGAAQGVAMALRRYIPVYLALRHLEKNQTSEYSSKLDSGWDGIWLRAAGYPKSPLTPTGAVSRSTAAARK